MRAAIYARYSSDLQSDSSIEDQVRLCRERAEREGMTVVEVFTDYAISGGHLSNRQGMLTLLEKAKTDTFDVVIAEALDRISRDQEDIAGIYKRLSHTEVKIITLSEGEVSELHIGLKGTMNALFLKDLAAKVRRGQRGRAEAKRAAGGLSYGYEMVREIGADGEIERGLRAINPEHAEIILRIFEEYVAGRSPRAIAAGLNADSIPSPRGGKWNASTINGNRKRLHGILLNPLYAGLMIYGRLTYRKNPETGTRDLFVVPPENWVRIPMPEWQVIPTELWEAAQKLRMKAPLHGPHKARRPRHLFSGLIRCGVCEGAYTMRSSDRLGCVAHREKSTCSNQKTLRLSDMESRVLSGLKEKMLVPDLYETFAEEFEKELMKLQMTQKNSVEDLEQKLTETINKIDRIVDAIAMGTSSSSLSAKLSELEDIKSDIEANMLAKKEIPDSCALPLNFPEIYRQQVTQLETKIKNPSATYDEAKNILRSFVEKIVVHPKPGRGNAEIEVFGSLADIIAASSLTTNHDVTDESVGMMVPRGGFEPPTRGFSVRCSTN